MAPLSSFINSRKAKSVIKSPFAYLRGEPSTSPIPPVPVFAPPPPSLEHTEVIDINDQGTRYSLDFDGGKPIDDYEKNLVDEQPRLPRADTNVSPQVQLDIELSQDALTDWFPTGFLRNSTYYLAPAKEQTLVGSSGLRNEVSNQSSSSGSFRGINGKNGTGSLDGDDESYSTSSEDVLANLQAMNPSHFGKLPGYDTFNRLEHPSPKKSTPNSITIPSGSSQSQNNPAIVSGDTSMTFSPNLGPLSASIDTPASSAISGTTLARALMSNSFILPHDNRMSRYRTSVAGLTRSDSTTLPRAEHSFGAAYNHDRFSIGPDAPPIPSNAEQLYEPPKKPRGTGVKEKRSQNLKRRSSTGSLNARNLPDTPSTNSNRPNSVLFSPGVEFDVNAILLRTPEEQTPPSLPRSPLPPTPRLPYSAGADRTSFTQESLSDKSYQEALQQFPLDSQLMSPDLTQLSPAASSEGPLSAKNYEDVLDYYSLPDSPAINISGNSYRPAFSPISEESTSQLSPPAPYRSDKRESIRSQPVGARSPLTGSLRVRGESVPLPRVPSESRMRQQLYPIGERPRSATQLPSPASAHSGSSFASAGSDLLAPPPISTIFNRARSGSAPSPIMVARDSKDANAYKITITPRFSELGTPTEEDEQMVMQDFPETPDAFSPLLTTDINGSSSMMQTLDGHEVMPMSDVPLSATFPNRGSLQPNLAQQLLLNRSATTIRHSRQTSISKIRTNGIAGRSGSPSSRRIADIAESPSESPLAALDQFEPTLDAFASLMYHKSSTDALLDSPEVVPAEPGPIILPTVPDIIRSPSRSASFTQGSDSSSMYTPSIRSESSKRMKSLPSIPVSPLVPSPAASNTSMRSRSPSPGVPEPSPPVATISPPIIPPPPAIPPPSPTPSQKLKTQPVRSRLPPALTINSSNITTSQRAVAVNGAETNSETSPAPFAQEADTSVDTIPGPASSPLQRESPPALGVQEITVPNQLYEHEGNFGDRASDIFRGTSLGSPPPYYSVVSDAINQTEAVNSPPDPTFSRMQTFNFGAQSTGVPSAGLSAGVLSATSHNGVAGPSATITEWGSFPNGDTSNPPLARENSVVSQRARRRPPLPAGPRRPSQIQLMGGHTSQSYQRDRAGSVSSVASTSLRMQASRNHSEASPAFSPKFQTPAPKWRGYTMEAAKWTFTSAQLQAIVSRAIRQSAEASSIRLLRLEILDNEIPEEIRRLEAQRTDLKTRYKVLAKKRAALFDALTLYMGGSDEDNAPYVLRVVEELRDVSINLDKLTEELHSLDAQLAHLDSLTQIHTGSALAMALRKLNASFLKQVGENQALRNQIQALEAERDEAWQQAEFLADEYDRMNEKIDDLSSKRSSRVSAVRKSSVRVSKAGLRTPSQRLSQVSSHGSGMHNGLTPSSAKSPLLRLERSIPPVPPIPRRRTLDGLGSPLKSSAALSSSGLTPGLTPTSETRALARVQDELYAMLGLVNPERTLRRSLSFSMLQGNSPSTASAQPPTLRPNPPANATNSWRRSSLPGDDALAETYNAMAADRNAILATINMLSSTD